jgi:hypothetical protein
MAIVKRAAARRSIHDSRIHSIQPRMDTDENSAKGSSANTEGSLIDKLVFMAEILFLSLIQ